jgi:hypothetical protein
MSRLAVAVVLATLIVSACSTTSSPSANVPATLASATDTPAITKPIALPPQVAHPQLGGTNWLLVELDGQPVAEPAYLSFWFAPGAGTAVGEASSDCSFIAFEYGYDRTGSEIHFAALPEGDGSYAEGCSVSALAQHSALAAALARVAEWRRPQADQLELIDAAGKTVLSGGPPPPLPAPPSGGDCGAIPLALCEEAATQAFNFGLFLEPGQRVVGWRVREAASSTCASQGIEPKFDVTFELEDPAGEKVATVGEFYGKLRACGDY